MKRLVYRLIEHHTRLVARMVAEQVGYFAGKEKEAIAAVETVCDVFWQEYLKDRNTHAAATTEEQITIVETLLARVVAVLRQVAGSK